MSVSCGNGIPSFFGLNSDRTVVTWGNNDHGILNIPKDEDGTDMGFTRISTDGVFYSIGLNTEGEIIFWGLESNEYREIFDGFSNGRAMQYVDVSTGYSRCAVLTTEGEIIICLLYT